MRQLLAKLNVPSPDMSITKSNYSGFDDMRFVATIGVILLHTSAGLVSLFGKVSVDHWITGLLFSTATRFAVPLFVMISGALLLSREYTLKTYLQKRFARVLLPFLFYAFFYLTYHLIIRLTLGHHNSFGETINWLSHKFATGISYHFWFVYLIIGLYLIIPFMSKWLRNATNRELGFILLFWLGLNLMGLTVFKNNLIANISPFVGYAGYLILGLWLWKLKIRNLRRTIVWALVLIFSGWAITAITAGVHSKEFADLSPFFQRNFSPNISAMAIGVFLFFKCKEVENQWWIAIRKAVCEHSFGIYLIHILILKWFSMIHIHWNFTYPLLAVPTTLILTVFFSYLFVKGVSKLPYGKYISG